MTETPEALRARLLEIADLFDKWDSYVTYDQLAKYIREVAALSSRPEGDAASALSPDVRERLQALEAKWREETQQPEGSFVLDPWSARAGIRRCADELRDVLAARPSAQTSSLTAAQEEIARLRDEIGEAREACPIVRRQDYFDASLLTAVNHTVSQLFQMQSRAERAEQSLREKDAEIERLNVERLILADTVIVRQERQRTLRERERTLREALFRYGRHDTDCTRQNCKGLCSCGFSGLADEGGLLDPALPAQGGETGPRPAGAQE